MKIMKMTWMVILLTSSSLVFAENCRGRNCSNNQETYESIEYARERVEAVVDRYFNEALVANGLSPVEIADRHMKASAWAVENSARPPVHIMDAWEAEYFFKLRVLIVADSRFRIGFPADVQSVLRTYHSRKLESLSDAAGG